MVAFLTEVVKSVRKYLWDKGIAILVTVIAVSLVFVVARHETTEEELVSKIDKDVRVRVNADYATSGEIRLDNKGRPADFQIGLVGQPTFIVAGEYDAGGATPDRFLATFDEVPQNYLDALFARQRPIGLSSILYFSRGFPDTLTPTHERVFDVDGDGRPEILIDLVSYFADGSSVSPLVLKWSESGWFPILMPDLSEEAKAAYGRWAKTVGSGQTTASEVPEIGEEVEGDAGAVASGRSEVFALRRDGYYKYFCSPNDGHVQMLVTFAYMDAPVQAPHVIFSAVLRLNQDHWEPDIAWNLGAPFLSKDKVDIGEGDLLTIYNAGNEAQKADGMYLWGPSFGVDVRNSKVDCAP